MTPTHGEVTQARIRLETRVAGMGNAFRWWKGLLIALSPLVLGGFVMGVKSQSVARKSDVAAIDDRLSSVENRQALQASDHQHDHEDLLEIKNRVMHIEELLMHPQARHGR